MLNTWKASYFGKARPCACFTSCRANGLDYFLPLELSVPAARESGDRRPHRLARAMTGAGAGVTRRPRNFIRSHPELRHDFFAFRFCIASLAHGIGGFTCGEFASPLRSIPSSWLELRLRGIGSRPFRRFSGSLCRLRQREAAR